MPAKPKRWRRCATHGVLYDIEWPHCPAASLEEAHRRQAGTVEQGLVVEPVGHRVELRETPTADGSLRQRLVSIEEAAVMRGPGYEINPLVEEARRTQPKAYAAALKLAPEPTLFRSGDVPPFTASGMDPQLLLKLPWRARHAVAQAETTAAALEMFENYVGDPGLAEIEIGVHDEVSDYAHRVNAWLMDGVTGAADDPEIYDIVFGALDAGDPRMINKRTQESAPSLTEEQKRQLHALQLIEARSKPKTPDTRTVSERRYDALKDDMSQRRARGI